MIMVSMYFIAIVLPGHLDEKIRAYKNAMFEKYQCRVGLKSPAHITLIPPFWMETEKEEKLISDISALSSRFAPFPMATDHFAAFKPRTIFIATTPSESLTVLKKTTDHFFDSRSDYQLKIDRRPFHPHITIATRDLHKKDFFECWPGFAEKKFKEEWVADGLSLLRHNKKNWDVIFTSQFKNV